MNIIIFLMITVIVDQRIGDCLLAFWPKELIEQNRQKNIVKHATI
jgi:hypothetical protein